VRKPTASQSGSTVRVLDVDEQRTPSFFAFAHHVRPELVRLARALASPSDGEDIAQDALFVVWQRWDDVRRFDSPAHWSRRVTANLAVTRHRRIRLERERIPALVSPDQAPDRPREPDEPLWRAVRSLPERQRVAVALRILEDRSYTDIAEILGCSADSARQLLHRGLARLRTTVAPSEHHG
jgi:RNA polymerase sigma factor (sigma-70 family)